MAFCQFDTEEKKFSQFKIKRKIFINLVFNALCINTSDFNAFYKRLHLNTFKNKSAIFFLKIYIGWTAGRHFQLPLLKFNFYIF